MQVDDSRLDYRAQVVAVDGYHSLESMHAEENDVVGERSSGKSGAGTAWDEWNSMLGKSAHNLDGFVPVAGKHRDSRHAPVTGESVGVVYEQIALALHDESRSDDFFELVD